MHQSLKRLPPLAIDYGNTYCRCAIYDPVTEEVVIFTDSSVGDCLRRYIHSYVAFNANSPLVGNLARAEAIRNPSHSVCWIKRLLGRRPSDVTSLTAGLCCQTKISCDGESERLKFCENQYLTEEIAAMLLSRLREMAEERMERHVNTTFITVPACFNDAQREAIVNAAEIAGFYRVHLLNETTAASVVYAAHNTGTLKDSKNVVFYDLGGGHVNVSVCKITSTQCRVLGTAGTVAVGGDNFDECVATKLAEESERTRGVNMRESGWNFMRLRLACERAKRILSYAQDTTIMMTKLGAPLTFARSLTQTEFTSMCWELFESAVKPVTEALSVANLSTDDIDDVVILGGASRMPHLQTLLRNIFHHRELNKTFHSEETVVVGAALYAARMTNFSHNPLDVCDVLAHAIGIEQSKGICHTLISSNTPIPCIVRVVLSKSPTSLEPHLEVRLYDGSRALASDNRYLGSFKVTKLQPLTNTATVELILTSSGILKVKWLDELLDVKKTGLSAPMKSTAKRRFTSMLAGDTSVMTLKERRRHLEKLICDLRLTTQAPDMNMNEADRHYIHGCTANFFAWLSKHQRATLAEVEDKISEVTEKASLLFSSSRPPRVWSPISQRQKSLK
ncbi:Major heat shock 70 kDa protein Bbb [Echinococcus granulosus]|uniref:Heat shock protein 70 n=1 Tax=Echinococcus granulosus TaxID=6210 RepID=U6JM84_ECHGR|nr:Major heat shock protein Bbb [Echinococcus granulosus]EUB59896.1 Major heat shock protein Bbb [Echinococcus granulosus]KAH9284736.1 Major heat shock 70 kDa protein Bbb [Echinococcus granulosus]CDS24467.1 heat shock protein 70 [Echinococcus granulosus]